MNSWIIFATIVIPVATTLQQGSGEYQCTCVWVIDWPKLQPFLIASTCFLSGIVGCDPSICSVVLLEFRLSEILLSDLFFAICEKCFPFNSNQHRRFSRGIPLSSLQWWHWMNMILQRMTLLVILVLVYARLLDVHVIHSSVTLTEYLSLGHNAHFKTCLHCAVSSRSIRWTNWHRGMVNSILLWVYSSLALTAEKGEAQLGLVLAFHLSWAVVLIARFPLGGCFRVNKQKENLIGWRCRQCLSPSNQVAFFFVRAHLPSEKQALTCYPSNIFLAYICCSILVLIW